MRARAIRLLKKKVASAIGALLAAVLLTVMPAAAAAGFSEFNEKIADALQGDWGKINFNIRWRF